jgi:hypothetical protein
MCAVRENGSTDAKSPALTPYDNGQRKTDYSDAVRQKMTMADCNDVAIVADSIFLPIADDYYITSHRQEAEDSR